MRGAGPPFGKGRGCGLATSSRETKCLQEATGHYARVATAPIMAFVTGTFPPGILLHADGT